MANSGGLIPSTPPSGRRLDPIPNPPQPRLDASGAPISLNQSDRVLPDHLPDDVLFSLTRPEDIADRLHPVRRSMSEYPRKPTAPAWLSARQRDRLTFLLKNNSCLCGAGRDISFLYDASRAVSLERVRVSAREAFERRVLDKFDASADRKAERDRAAGAPSPKKEELNLPDSLIPDEYKLVKSRGVLGLEYFEDKYAMKPEDHEKHLVVFPSLKPNSRFETKMLEKTLDQMLGQAGVSNPQLEGPTQLHNLLELIKKEQDVCNVAMSEVIRQVSVDCVERGALLAKIREQYAGLLAKVPPQIEGLHEELLAQRAVDRHLTEELIRFRTIVGVLTNELSELKMLENKNRREALRAQEELQAAVEEAEKNASLINEYHELYELQRKRLEKQLGETADERELWSTTAYSLAVKLIEERSLTLARRMHVAEKAWAKLAKHFALRVTEADSSELQQSAEFVARYRTLAEQLWAAVVAREADLVGSAASKDEKQTDKSQPGGLAATGVIDIVTREIIGLKQSFQNQFQIMDGLVVKVPTGPEFFEIAACLKKCYELVMPRVDVFGGEEALALQEKTVDARNVMCDMVQLAMRICSRHEPPERALSADSGAGLPPDTPGTVSDRKAILNMNEFQLDFLDQASNRLQGENGVARALIALSETFETQHTRFQQAVLNAQSAASAKHQLQQQQAADAATAGSGQPPPSAPAAPASPLEPELRDSEWLAYQATLDDWLERFGQLRQLVGNPLTEKDQQKAHHDATPKTLNMAVTSITNWSSGLLTSMQQENAKLAQQIAAQHSDMVKWLVQVLLRLAPARSETSAETNELQLLGTLSLSELAEKCVHLCTQLDRFSHYIDKCCTDIVMADVMRRTDAHDENADFELKELQRLQTEASEWIRTATLLTKEVQRHPVPAVVPLCQPPPSASGDEPQPLMQPQKPEERQPSASVATPSPEHESGPTAAQSAVSASAAAAVGGEQPVTQQLPLAEPPTTATATASTEQKEGAPTGEQQQQPSSFQAANVQHLGEDLNTYLKAIIQDPKHAPLTGVGPDVADKPRPITPTDAQHTYVALKTVEQLQTQLIDAEKRAQEAERQAAESNLRVTELTADVDLLREKLERAERRVAELEPALAAANAQLATLLPQQTDEERQEEHKGLSPPKPDTAGGSGPASSRSSGHASRKSGVGKGGVRFAEPVSDASPSPSRTPASSRTSRTGGSTPSSQKKK